MSLQKYDDETYDEHRKEILKEIQRQFHELDENGTGTIREHELVTAAQRLKINMTRAEAKSIIAEHDKDESNSIEYKEYEDMMLAHYGCLELQNQELADAFDKFDRDNSGYLDVEELCTCLLNKGEKFSKEELDEFLALGDNNKDGKLNKAEFINLLSVDPAYRQEHEQERVQQE